jgi:hypothetical protein
MSDSLMDVVIIVSFHANIRLGVLIKKSKGASHDYLIYVNCYLFTIIEFNHFFSLFIIYLLEYVAHISNLN